MDEFIDVVGFLWGIPGEVFPCRNSNNRDGQLLIGVTDQDVGFSEVGEFGCGAVMNRGGGIGGFQSGEMGDVFYLTIREQGLNFEIYTGFVFP